MFLPDVIDGALFTYVCIFVSGFMEDNFFPTQNCIVKNNCVFRRELVKLQKSCLPRSTSVKTGVHKMSKTGILAV